MGWIDRLGALDASGIPALLNKAHPGCMDGLPRQIAIVGATHLGETVAEECAVCGIELSGIFDDAPNRQGTAVAGHVVQPSSALEAVPRETPIVLATHRLLNLTRRLRGMGFAHAWPFPLLHIVWPEHFSAHPFYEDLHADLLRNTRKIFALHAMLADDASRDTLDAVIGFRLTLDVEILAPALRPQAYFPEDIFALDRDETYCDGGAYSGDTITDFLARTDNQYAQIIAFEPSSGSYADLVAKFSAMPNIRCVQACLHHTDMQLLFNCSNNRDSCIAPDSGEACDALCIDNLPEATELSLIKLNIEGAEEDALRGASATLSHHAPKLSIAAYHRPRDIWLLPELVRELQPSYSLYLRQHDGGIIETVLYACP